MQSKNKQLVIIDGNAIIHRAYHALPPLSSPQGELVNAVYGFSSMLLKVLKDINPTHIAVSFDVAGKTFRDEIYEDYKATREKADQDLYDQIPHIYDVVRAFDIPIYTKEGYEADDILGTIPHKLEKDKWDGGVIIVTGDMDILQLVNKSTLVYAFRKGLSDMVFYDEAAVHEKYGFGPERVVDYKALRGDPSDNIPGVVGIGDKGAKQLIAVAGSIENIYDTLDKLEDKGIRASVVKKLKEGKDNAVMSKELATIEKNVPDLGFNIEDCKRVPEHKDELRELFFSFGFTSLVKRLDGSATGKKKKLPKRKNVEFISIASNDIGKLVSEIQETQSFSCKEIVTGPNLMHASLLGLVFGLPSGNYHVSLKEIDKQEWKKLMSMFNDTKIELIGYDLKLFIKIFIREGIMVKNKLFDIKVASYIVDASLRDHAFAAIVQRELGTQLNASDGQTNLFEDETLSTAEHVSYMLLLARNLELKLKEQKTIKLFETIEMPLVPVLARMELEGIKIDIKKLEKLSKEVAGKIEILQKKIWKEAGEEFNVSSSAQLRVILFEKLELPTQGIKKGKTGYSTAASELKKLRELHPMIEFIESYRELTKLQNTYIDVLPQLVDTLTGRLYTSFNQTVAATGRLSSSDPNLQNIPIKTEQGREIREAFIAEKGYELIAADYSQIELRIAASLANDKAMIETFERGEDIHSTTAAAIHGVKLEEVTKSMRRKAKEVNFGVLYGMGSFGLAERSDISVGEARDFIAKYFQEFSGVREYMDNIKEVAKEKGYVETLFGRRRNVPELNSKSFQVRASGERMAINMPVQGTAADIMKLAMIAVDKRVHEDFDTEDVKILLQVHDELILEVKTILVEKVGKLVKEEMEKVVELKVPVLVEVHSGKNWGELK